MSWRRNKAVYKWPQGGEEKGGKYREHQVNSEGSTIVRIMFVTIDSADEDRHAINEQLGVSELDFPEANVVDPGLHHPAIVEGNHQLVHVWGLGRPLLHIVDDESRDREGDLRVGSKGAKGDAVLEDRGSQIQDL